MIIEPENRLPAEFRSDDFDFTLVKRVGDVVILKKRRSKWTPNRFTYEVVIIQQHEAKTIKGSNGILYDYPNREAMPVSEDWGVFGWTCSDLESAELKLKTLVDVLKNGDSTPL